MGALRREAGAGWKKGGGRREAGGGWREAGGGRWEVGGGRREAGSCAGEGGGGSCRVVHTSRREDVELTRDVALRRVVIFIHLGEACRQLGRHGKAFWYACGPADRRPQRLAAA